MRSARFSQRSDCECVQPRLLRKAHTGGAPYERKVSQLRTIVREKNLWILQENARRGDAQCEQRESHV